MNESDRQKESLNQLVRTAMPRADYQAMYAATVASQNADLTLELKPDAETLPPLSKVPIRTGIPGVEAKVAKGSRVLIGFDSADPSKAYAALWEKNSLTELVVTATAKVTVAAPNVVVNSASVELGGTPAVQPVIKGTAYTGAEITMLGLLATALTELAQAVPSIGTLIPKGPTAAAACAAAATAVTTFSTAIPATLSLKVKTQ